MELRHLRYFVVVAAEQNITRAAARLRVAQPSLSRQIRQLEEDLGFALFEHAPRAVRLTDAGREFLKGVQEVLRQLGEAVTSAKAVSSGTTGELHVGYAPSLTVGILPAALRLFEQTSPNVRVRLRDLSTKEMLCSLHDKQLHVALVVHPYDKALPGLIFHPLLQLDAGVAVARTHRLARAKTVGLPDIAAERLLAYSHEDYPEYHEWLDGIFAPIGKTPPVAEEHDSSVSLIAAVEAGRGVALVLDGMQSLAGSRLKIRRITPPPAPHSLGIAHLEGPISPVAKSFLDAVLSLKLK